MYYYKVSTAVIDKKSGCDELYYHRYIVDSEALMNLLSETAQKGAVKGFLHTLSVIDDHDRTLMIEATKDYVNGWIVLTAMNDDGCRIVEITFDHVVGIDDGDGHVIYVLPFDVVAKVLDYDLMRHANLLSLTYIDQIKLLESAGYKMYHTASSRGHVCGPSMKIATYGWVVPYVGRYGEGFVIELPTRCSHMAHGSNNYHDIIYVIKEVR